MVNLSSGMDIKAHGHTYRILERGVFGEQGRSATQTSRATRVLPDESLFGKFILKISTKSDTDTVAIQLRNAHPEIPHETLAAFECDEAVHGEPYVARFLPGKSLKSVIAEERLITAPSNVVIPLAWQIAMKVMRTLAPLRTAGLIHGDVKDGNLIVQSHEIGLIDNEMLTNAEEVTQEPMDHIVGTPIILAPEAIRSRHAVSPSTDDYAAACTIWAMMGEKLAGYDVQETLNERTNGKFRKRLKEKLGERRKKTEPELALVMHRLYGWLDRTLEQNPKDRPQTTEEHFELLFDTPNLVEL